MESFLVFLLFFISLNFIRSAPTSAEIHRKITNHHVETQIAVEKAVDQAKKASQGVKVRIINLLIVQLFTSFNK